MTPRGWIVVEHYLSALGDWFEHEIDGVTLRAECESPGTNRFRVTAPDEVWHHTIEVTSAPDGNGVVWRVPALDARSALFSRTSDEALALVAQMHALSPLAMRINALAAQADELARGVRAARDGADAIEQRLTHPLDEVAARAVQAVGELRAAAADLIRYATRPARACMAYWGVCPDHGATLELDRGRPGRATRCRVRECERTWEYDRAAHPCMEASAFRTRAPNGDEMDMCTGHVVALRRIENAHEWGVEPLRRGGS